MISAASLLPPGRLLRYGTVHAGSARISAAPKAVAGGSADTVDVAATGPQATRPLDMAIHLTANVCGVGSALASLAAALKLNDDERARALHALNGLQQPQPPTVLSAIPALDEVTTVALGLLESASEPRAHELADAALAEFARRASQEGHGAAQQGVRILTAATSAGPYRVPTLPQKKAVLSALQHRPADSLAAAAALVRSVVRAAPDHQAALHGAAAALDAMRPLAATPQQADEVDLLHQLASRESYSAEHVLPGVLAGLSRLGSAPETSGGEPLADFTHRLSRELHYWEDAADFIRLGLGAMRQRADRPMQDALDFLERNDDGLDGPTEEERVDTMRMALDWLASHTVTNAGTAMRDLCQVMRGSTKGKMRDVHTVETAAATLVDAAARDHRNDDKHAARFLQWLAGQRVEYVEERHQAVARTFDRMLERHAGGTQQLSSMAATAIDVLRPYLEKLRVARFLLDELAAAAQTRGDVATESVATELQALTRIPFNGDKSRRFLSTAITDALASAPSPGPGTLAGVGLSFLEGAAEYSPNARLLAPPLLDGIERTARGMGDARYVPELVGLARERLAASPDDATHAAVLRQSLQELRRFSGDTFTQMVVGMARREQSGEPPRVRSGEREVNLGGVKVPIRSAR